MTIADAPTAVAVGDVVSNFADKASRAPFRRRTAALKEQTKTGVRIVRRS